VAEIKALLNKPKMKSLVSEQPDNNDLLLKAKPMDMIK